jgi:4-alpha-glucanotransferase
VQLPRSSGVLLHPTSLPGGRLGDEAYRFVDWLERAGQSWWQILPLGPPDDAGSPYKASSAFAGWPGLLAEPDAPVAVEESEPLVAAEASWIGHWAKFAGPGALADQVRFAREWGALRRYAAERGIRLIGDLPIYVAEGGADHVSNPEIFQQGVVGGVPPDDFSETGQLWGNPVYDWTALRAQGYRWWIERFRRTFELVDVTRVDHFRGFVAYWAVPEEDETAENGSWRPGPGRELFDAVEEALGELPIVAEDLGVITPPVVRLRDELELPGMIVLQFVLATHVKNPQTLGDEENRIIYSGTHDNDTTRGWWEERSPDERENVRATLAASGIEDDDPVWAIVRFALASKPCVAIMPAQDVLGLGSAARMNFPGKAEGNWSWRLEPGQLTDALADRLRAETEVSRRLPWRRSTT